MSHFRALMIGLLLGASAATVVVTQTSVGQWLPERRTLPPSASLAIQHFDHGIPANLHFLPHPNGVKVEGLGTNDIQNIGVIIRVTLHGPNGKMRPNVEALVDTGADSSFVSKAVMDDLDLQPALQNVHVDEGISSVTTGMAFYVVVVELPGGAMAPARVGATNQNGRQQMLIGRDILSKGVFVYDGPKNQATLSFPPG